MEEQNQHSNSAGSHPSQRRLSGLEQPFAEPRTAWSATAQGIPRSITAPGLFKLSDQPDGVDGAGAVTLRDGAEEEEYFGTVIAIPAT